MALGGPRQAMEDPCHPLGGTSQGVEGTNTAQGGLGQTLARLPRLGPCKFLHRPLDQTSEGMDQPVSGWKRPLRREKHAEMQIDGWTEILQDLVSFRDPAL